jgi:tRNA 2-thiocytidine biosynthesis protein TtcA
LSGSANAFKVLNRAIGKAIHDYDMIRQGDRIAVGLSGGADSLALLWMLSERKRRVPVRYDLAAVHIDLGFAADGAGEILEDFCRRLGVPLRVAATDIGVVSHSPANRENPCFLCARRRRQRLFEIADEMGCNKLALGHSKDDIIETLFLNICYAGEISTMRPFQPVFQGRFAVLRPLVYADKDCIRRFTRQQGFTIIPNACPSSTRSRRSEIQQMLQTLYRGNPKVKGNIFHALRNVRQEYLLKEGLVVNKSSAANPVEPAASVPPPPGAI